MNEQELLTKKIDFIKKLKTISPQMKVHFINQTEQKIWENEKTLSNLTNEEVEIVNLRKQLPDEIILDVEEKYRVEDIKTKLKEKGWSYELWNTGSRGVHFVLKFGNLHLKELSMRNRVRRYVIDEFQTDNKLAKETQWMCLEWSKHFKSNKEKTLVENQGDGINFIPEDIFKYCQKELELENEKVLESDDAFKDFLTTDPYLKYVLENKVVDGGRNDMLFKNIAIGLVRSGLTREEIEKVGKAVVKNCPGKNIGEFMGWVSKAVREEYLEFNKYELVQWSLLYKHPVLYKDLVKDEQYVDLLTIKQLWDIIWNGRIAQQPVWKDLCFYNMISAILQEEDKDLRAHVIFSCMSSTGKDEGISLVEQILNKLGLITHVLAEITDRTLVGSINQYAIETNTKKDLKEGDEKYREVIDMGILAKGKSDWVAFPEAESVFKPGPYNKKMQLIFRQVMDKRRQIKKGVGGHIINLYTNTVLMLSTYSMDKDIYSLLMNGLFQRTLFYRKQFTHKDHKAVRRYIVNRNFNPLIIENYDEIDYINILVQKLNTMKLWYDENKNNIKYSKTIDETINYYWDKYEDSYEVLTSQDRDLLDSIVRRSTVNLDKLIKITAIWNMKTNISTGDIDICFNLLKDCIDSVKNLITSQDRSTKQIDVALLLLKDGSMKIMNLYAQLEEILNVKSEATKAKILKKIENLGYITKFKDGRDNMVMLTEKGFERVKEGDD